MQTGSGGCRGRGRADAALSAGALANGPCLFSVRVSCAPRRRHTLGTSPSWEQRQGRTMKSWVCGGVVVVVVGACISGCGAGSGTASDKYQQTWTKNYGETTCADWSAK